MSQLNIYKASAGAGKTFALTLEYFRIIFSVPSEYRNILAVTFTNKATEEMKSRIIKELHKLAEGQKSSYGEILQSDFGYSEDQLKNKAMQLRTMLLHDYGRIAVTTIDRFFQRILKSFTRELGIFPGYNVELDSDYVLLKAVDKVMEEIKEDADLKRWLGELMEDRVEGGQSWNIKYRMIALGEELFKEDYMQLDSSILSKFSDKNFLQRYREFLKKIIRGYEEGLRALSQEAIRVIEEAGLSYQSFKGGKQGCAYHFYKLKDGKFDDVTTSARNAVGNSECWIAQSCKADIAERLQAVYPILNDLLKRCIEMHDDQNCHYHSACQLLSNLYQLGILHDLYRKVREYCDEKGLMLLSDTTRMLNILIEGNDTSFLFEKTGNYYKHLMIDEFQDTSALQWRNFRPLVVNSLSEGHQAMIVGDVKQSIYRWRNGDWQLLAGKVEKEFGHLGTKNIVLQSNWRSAYNIVNFNNIFFREAALELKEIYDLSVKEENGGSAAILQAYDKLEQTAKSDQPGYVDVRFGPSVKEEDKERYMMKAVTDIITDILERGGRLKDIVILVRSGKEGACVADYLMEYNKTSLQEISFISNDSLYIWASPYVRFVVALLRYIVEPYDKVNKAFILHFCNSFIQPCREEEWDTVFRSVKEENLSHFPNAGLKFDVGEVASYSLYETVEAIIDNFSLKNRKTEVPYLIAFQDVVFEYETNNSNSIVLFLEWWEKERHKRVLSTAEEVDAVRILTIHKAKGLEFDHVILPFCTWELDSMLPVRRIWCTNTEKDFCELEYAPLNYSTKLADTLFKNDFYEEHLKAYVDNLNLLYVALTRAKKELYVRSYMPAFNKDGSLSLKDIGAFMYRVLGNLKEKGCAFNPDSVMNVEYGNKYRYKKTADESLSLSLDNYVVYASEARISIKYKYQDYSDPDRNVRTAVDEGKLLHEIFRSIEHREDIGKAVRRVYLEGLIDRKNLEAYREKVEKYISRPDVSEWFSPEYRIINERDILFRFGAKARPDRILVRGDEAVVIDYKFGWKEDLHYQRQVRFYCNTLKEMGYSTVRGFIWYVFLEKITVVK